jgi:hypothetical protein
VTIDTTGRAVADVVDEIVRRVANATSTNGR